jgi:hypothetical protein
MSMKLSKSSIAIVSVALLIAAYGLITAPKDDQENLVVSSKKAASKTAPVAQSRASEPSGSDLSERISELTTRVDPSRPVGQLFASNVPPVTQARSRPARTAPQAPPFPYVYMGSLLDGSDLTVYLAGNDDRIVLAHIDQTIDGVYHVDQLDAKQLTVTYVPLKRQQTISLAHIE